MDPTTDPASSPSLRARLVTVCRVVKSVVKAPFQLLCLTFRIVSAPFRAVRSIQNRRAAKKAAKQQRRDAKRFDAMAAWEKEEVERARALRED
jgi:hypothetical protein